MAELLKIENLRVRFLNNAPDHWAVDGVSLSLNEGEIVGLVGESGSGKTVTAMSASGLLNRGRTLTEGSVRLAGREMLWCEEKELRSIQGDLLSVVFQEPMTSLDPVRPVGPQVEESLRLHTKLPSRERKARALEAMDLAELPEPATLYRKYPHQLSGGMLQRVMIAAALINQPRLLLADEPTTALDVTVQAEILNLLKKINQEQGTAILFISHDLHVVRRLCRRVAVMRRGKIVETGDTEEIFRAPQHEYTRRLIAAIPTRERKPEQGADYGGE